MAGFLYFIEQAGQAVDGNAIAAAGLAYAMDAALQKRQALAGPGGQPGVVIAAGEVPVEECGFFPERQTWRRKSPGVWAGWAKDRLPGPASLRRRETLGGHEVELLDGNRWLVPVARKWIEEDGELRWTAAVPRRATLDDEGRWVEGPVVGRFAPLWALAERWEASKLAAFVARKTGEEMPTRLVFDFAGLMESAVEVLAVNYRIGPVEADVLGILGVESAIAILDALIDMPTRLAWIKKNARAEPARDGGNTDSGPPDSIVDTGPP